MKKLKREEMVVMATCQNNKKVFGITAIKTGNNYEFAWAFKINPDSAKREGFESNHVVGNIYNANDFPGCPHCGAPSWYQCGKCKRFVCLRPGTKIVKCPECGNEGELQFADSFDLNGGAL